MQWWEQVNHGSFDPYFKEDDAIQAYQKNYQKKMDEAMKVLSFKIIIS